MRFEQVLVKLSFPLAQKSAFPSKLLPILKGIAPTYGLYGPEPVCFVLQIMGPNLRTDGILLK